jgi:hypothetical protein
MANTKVTGDLIASGTITAANLVSGTLDTLLNGYLTTNSYATESYVTTAVSNLIDAAPASLDTLNELAAALNDDANFATTVTDSIATKLPLAGGNITGNLSVDTNVLFVDTANDRVGIGTSSPTSKTHIVSGVDYNTLTLSRTDSTSTPQRVNIIMPNFANDNKVGLFGGADIAGSSVDALIGVNPGSGSSPNNIKMFTASTYGAIGPERMRIDSAGNVGIGTTDPSAKLDVASSSAKIAEFERIGSANYDLTISDLGAGAAQLWFNANTNDTGFLFRPRNSSGTILNALMVDPSGNVGIGATSPLGKLEINTTGPNNQILLTQSTTDHMSVLAGSDGGGLIITENNYFGIWHQPFSDRGGQNNLSERFRITSTGNVGIGTSSPTAFSGRILHIHDSSISRLKLTNDTTGSTNFDGFEALVSGGDVLFVNRENANMTFSTNATERMRIDSSGGIGVGTSTVLNSAQIQFQKGTAWGTSDNKVINITNVGSGGNINQPHNLGSITWYTGTSPTASIDAWRNTPGAGELSELRFSTGVTGSVTEKMRITSGGSVLIGTTTATEKLTVSGNAYVDGRIASFQTEQAVAAATWIKAFTVPDDSAWRVWCGYTRTDAAVSSFTYFNVFKAASGAPAVADTPISATSNGSYFVQLRLNGNDVEFQRSGSFGGGNRQVAVSAIRLW